MRSLATKYIVACTSAAVLLGAALWFALPLSANGAQASAKNAKASAKQPAKKQHAVQPPLRAERSERMGRRTQSGSQADDPKPGVLDGQADNIKSSREEKRQPREHHMQRAASFDGDVRVLPQTVPVRKRERPEREGPEPSPVPFPGTAPAGGALSEPISSPGIAPGLSAPAPSPTFTFEGLDFANWGAGHPPDTNGDVGPTYYIETVNTSIGIYNKFDGSRVAALTFNTFMSQGNFGNLCDTDNSGDPVVLYDTFEDRWVITDFAFKTTGGAVVNPPGAFQCFAVSKTGDPVSGGWNYYSINTIGGFGDYPKFGIWPDGLYMSTNMFGYAAGSSFQNVRLYAFNKAQMYAGAPTVQVVSFDAPPADFTLLPSNARLQTGTPPTGAPNYYVSTWQFLNALTVYKFHVDWNSIALSTFTGPDTPLAATSWPNASVPNAPSQGGNSLDVLQIRAMMQNQYSNIEGVESLWTTHTVRRQNTTGFAAPRWYQVNVTGGTVAANLPQAATWDPDGANVMYRFMPSLAVDRAGDMALGYSTSSSTTKPAIKYAGRLANDPLNTFSQTEQVLIQGAGTQTGTCGGSACIRWGDYSAMTLDPDGCTFWYTNEYYQADGLNDNTRIGAFSFPACSPIGSGTLQGTVKNTASIPIGGATVVLGSRTTTTDAGGNYSFTNLPAGTYPSITASFPGYDSQTFVGIVVTDSGTTTRDFSLSPAPTSTCLTDTTQADFLAGIPTNCDLTSSPGDVTLLSAPTLDQQNTTLGSSGFGVTTTQWIGQTFIPSVSGQLAKLDINMFCSSCSGTNPAVTVDIRTTSGGLPTSTILTSTTITGFSSGAAAYYTATFSSPATLTAGTSYAIILRLVTARSAGSYDATFSAANPYAKGALVFTTNGGTSFGTIAAVDLGFKIYMRTGFAPAGNFVSSVKDANPAVGGTPTWSTISWNASVPPGRRCSSRRLAATAQAGHSTSSARTAPPRRSSAAAASLAQFNGNRYLQYKALLTTTNSGATPTLNDVTVCYTNIPPAVATTLAVSAASGTYGGTTTLSATLTSGGSGVSGKSISFTLNGSGVGSALTDAAGVATLAGVSLAGINAGTYPGAVAANFAGDVGYTASSGSNDLTVGRADQTISFGALADKVFGDPDFSVSATASSGLTVSFAASGNCSISGSTVHLTGAGSCTVTASQAGDTNYNAAPDVPQAFSIAKADQTISFGPLANKTFGDPDFGVSATASSGLVVSFAASGNCSISGSTVHLTGAGSCTITASQAGDANYNAAPDVPQAFSIAKADQTISFGPLANKAVGDPDFGVSATASSGLAVSFSAAGNCTVAGAIVHITGAGSCTITASQAGDANYNAASDVPQTFAIGKANQTISFGPLANKTFGDPDFGVSATASSGLAVVTSARPETAPSWQHDRPPHRRRLLHDHGVTSRRRELQRSAGCSTDVRHRQSEPDDQLWTAGEQDVWRSGLRGRGDRFVRLDRLVQRDRQLHRGRSDRPSHGRGLLHDHGVAGGRRQ